MKDKTMKRKSAVHIRQGGGASDPAFDGYPADIYDRYVPDIPEPDQYRAPGDVLCDRGLRCDGHPDRRGFRPVAGFGHRFDVDPVDNGNHRTERGVGLPLLIAVAVGLAVGFVNGFLIAYCSLPAFIATLGTQTLLRGLALYIANGKPISGLSEKFTNVGGGSIGIVPIPVIILIILGLVTWYIMKYTRLGRHIYAIGGNAQAAVVSGVNAKRVKLFTYLYAGVMAAIAGVILTARVASGNAALGETYEMKAITGCVIGGVSLNGGIGSIYGMICGILVVGVLTNGMDLMNVSGYMQKVAEGIIMIIAVLLDVVRAKSAK